MKIIVTGATGFLGKRLVEILKLSNYSPIALGRNVSIGKHFLNKDIPFIPVELTNRNQTIESFKGADYVVHCAALSSVWGNKKDFINANVIAVQNVIDACQVNHVKRLIHISTPSIYFDYNDRYNLTENSPLPKRFINAYASSKKEGEDLIHQAFKNGLSTIVLRPRGIFGPGDTTIFPRILTAMQHKMLPLINNGKANLDITYIDNVVEAILLAIHAKDIDGQTYNITNDEPKTFIDLLNALSDKCQISLKTKKISFNYAFYSAKLVENFYRLFNHKKEPPITCYGVGLVSTSMTFDISNAKNQLKYSPKVSIAEGLENFAAWWRTSC